MENTELFTLALGLQEPWRVDTAEFREDADGQALHIVIGFRRGYRFDLGDGRSVTAYNTVQRTWQHLNFFQWRCFIHCAVPRVRDDRSTRLVSIPWTRPKSGFSLLFKAISMLLLKGEMPTSSIAATLGETQPRCWRVFRHWIDQAEQLEDWGGGRRIGGDETSQRKGHNYVTHFVDLDTHWTLFATQGKDQGTFERFVEALRAHGGRPECIEIVSMDMSAAFFAGARQFLPAAQIVYDKFHLVKELNDSFDAIRKSLHREYGMLKNDKWLPLRKSAHLSASDRGELDRILVAYPQLGEAYGLRESFLDVFEIADPEHAKGFLAYWCDKVLETGHYAFHKFVSTLKAHWFGIVAYFDCGRVANGILERLNTKIQLAYKACPQYAQPGELHDLDLLRLRQTSIRLPSQIVIEPTKLAILAEGKTTSTRIHPALGCQYQKHCYLVTPVASSTDGPGQKALTFPRSCVNCTPHAETHGAKTSSATACPAICPVVAA